MGPCVAFSVGPLSLALPLDKVVRTVRAVAASPLPQAPEVVLGVINVQGTIVPLVDLRRRFGLPEQELRLTDQLLIVHGATRVLAMVVDAVDGVTACDEHDFHAVESIVPGTRHVKGIVKRADGVVLVQDLDAFLSLEEERALDAAMASSG